LHTWRAEFLAHFTHTDVSNGPTESLNLKIKNTKPSRVRAPGCPSSATPPKRSGGLRKPTAIPEVDRGLPDGLKLGANLRVGV
jgi:Transposase